MAGLKQSLVDLQHLKVLVDVIRPAADKWDKLGIVLKIASKKLEGIRANDADEEFKLAMTLTIYLNNSNRELERNSRPTKEEVVAALKIIDANDLANDLDRIHIGDMIVESMIVN
jgi:hypothetical protein